MIVYETREGALIRWLRLELGGIETSIANWREGISIVRRELGYGATRGDRSATVPSREIRLPTSGFAGILGFASLTTTLVIALPVALASIVFLIGWLAGAFEGGGAKSGEPCWPFEAAVAVGGLVGFILLIFLALGGFILLCSAATIRVADGRLCVVNGFGRETESVDINRIVDIDTKAAWILGNEGRRKAKWPRYFVVTPSGEAGECIVFSIARLVRDVRPAELQSVTKQLRQAVGLPAAQTVTIGRPPARR